MTIKTPKGMCTKCERVMSKGGMTRHLQSCHGPGDRLLLAIAPEYGPWWMHVAASPRVTLAQLDHVLRVVWLECCGHLSAFEIDGVQYEASGGLASWGVRTRTMDRAIGDVLQPGGRFRHDYDFGSTTRLVGRCVGALGGEGLEVLARNDAIPWPCNACGEPAESICSVCGELSCGCEERCPECGEHLEDMSLPVVNSPRMGVCGYTG